MLIVFMGTNDACFPGIFGVIVGFSISLFQFVANIWLRTKKLKNNFFVHFYHSSAEFMCVMSFVTLSLDNRHFLYYTSPMIQAVRRQSKIFPLERQQVPKNDTKYHTHEH